ncbi:hypothetical protein D9613_011373 [Agrocybe pediades]|uniref:DUF6533 domain-containing protein n=1 Tax=Agrocybe pediades TaxID=84607 RepID=A0A8H4QRH4_9AGAR|nr:hypothetical protein D9613_011373 [Agrocybe pediades]
MSTASPAPESLAQAVMHLQAGKYFQIAAYVMLIYDHLLTFSVEVERIWKPKFSGASILFLINRYATPLQFIVIIDAFQDPIWTKDGASTIALIAVCEAIMILRVYALYGRSNWILGFLGFLWALQIVLSSVGIKTGFAVPLPPGLVGCIFSGSSPLFPAIWVTPLITDTCIFALTMWRTRAYLVRRSTGTPTLQLFMRDGFLYFFAILAANLLNMLLFFIAPADLRAIAASFSQLLTSTMVSRLVLNLRSLSYSETETNSDTTFMPTFVARTVRHLGEDMDSFEGDIPLRDVQLRK